MPLMPNAPVPFNLRNIESTKEITVMIDEYVHGICKEFADRGLPNFPAVIPFTFWAQYLFPYLPHLVLRSISRRYLPCPLRL